MEATDADYDYANDQPEADGPADAENPEFGEQLEPQVELTAAERGEHDMVQEPTLDL